MRLLAPFRLLTALLCVVSLVRPSPQPCFPRAALQGLSESSKDTRDGEEEESRPGHDGHSAEPLPRLTTRDGLWTWCLPSVLSSITTTWLHHWLPSRILSSPQLPFQQTRDAETLHPVPVRSAVRPQGCWERPPAVTARTAPRVGRPALTVGVGALRATAAVGGERRRGESAAAGGGGDGRLVVRVLRRPHGWAARARAGGGLVGGVGVGEAGPRHATTQLRVSGDNTRLSPASTSTLFLC